jgi:putative SOS response-associated peptidase YedK
MTFGRDDLSAVADELGAALDDAYLAAPPKPRFNVAPSDRHPVLLLRRAPGAKTRTLVPATWGLPAEGQRPALINARAETAAFRPTFRDAFAHRRCVVVTDGFYEWRREGAHKQPFWFHRADDGLLLFAGLFEERPARFTVLTTEANALVATIHDRMPAVLPTSREVDAWLDRPDRSLLRPAPEGLLVATPVSSRVNSVKHDDRACLAPADGDPDAGDVQLTLF